ncbi:MAG: GNAT family N-acetyltransferase [Cellulomonadaceae bacterium]|nr:GNAT family N-acetyltransferase [Cellulomonadaceae bacterium]
MRLGIEVRPAEPADLDALVALCLTARQESAVGHQVCTSDESALSRQLGALATAPGGMVLVGAVDGVPAGLLLGRIVGPNPFTDEVSLAVEAVYVGPEHRRRGLGHALMVGAADVAATCGAEHVYAAPIPGARGMQRFLVQLGFAPAAAHRVTSTSALQRRLAQDSPGLARRSNPRGIEDLIARRRQSRGSTSELPLVPVGAELVSAVGPDGQPGRRAAISRHVKRAVQIRRDLGSATSIS